MLLYEKPPREHVLLLSCMDLRLLDNIVVFMNKLNLQNRYDHLTLAGAAMGAMQLPNGPSVPHTLWKHVFFVHLEKAITELKRKIKDIFILEHLDCGAYKKLHPTKASEYTKYADDYDVTGMTGLHHAEARGFVEEIKEYLEDKAAKWKGDEKKKEDNPWRASASTR